jgi:DNA-binding YbaB/EbfC family protein
MNPFDLLKNTQAIKEQTEKLKEELASIRVEGSSGGKMVVVTMNGQFEMIDIKLDPICVDNRDVQMLQDLIVAANKNAMENVQEQIKAKSSSLLGGLGGLGGMDFSQFGL